MFWRRRAYPRSATKAGGFLQGFGGHEWRGVGVRKRDDKGENIGHAFNTRFKAAHFCEGLKHQAVPG
ncbi:hypothetical protein BC1002_0646 [Paraburkholderia atlantica]|uniref:Uncharacterized protein n=1 Tax=Paraburkholderia atlantica TaxID=2654982 RepID=D5WCW6_PARAM|nr:hypothetical protein BC1002_0646 [Paraburkholderia atlantica]